MRSRSLFDFVVLGFVWGSAYSLIAVALEGMTPLQVAQVRTMGGAVVLLIVLFVSSAERRALSLTPKFLVAMLGSGLISTAAPYLLISWGETKAPSAIAGMLGATTPIFTAIMAPILLKERLGFRRGVGVAIGLGGMLLIFHPWQGSARGDVVAELAVVVAAALYGLSFIYLKRFVYPLGASTKAIAAGQIVMASLVLLCINPTGPAVLFRAGIRVDSAILTLGILQTGFAAVLSVRLVKSVTASVSSSVTYLIALVSVFEGFVFQHQSLGVIFFVGGAVTMIGLVIASTGEESTRRMGIRRSRATTAS